MWFRPNPGKDFPHVFVGEKSSQTYTGFHNWYQLYLERTKISDVKVISYSCFTKPLKFIKLEFVWDTLPKYPPNSATSMLVGTSPAFDFGLFTCVSLHKKEMREEDRTALAVSAIPSYHLRLSQKHLQRLRQPTLALWQQCDEILKTWGHPSLTSVRNERYQGHIE